MMTKPKAPPKAPPKATSKATSTGMETMDVTVWTVNRPEQDQAREDRIEFEAIVDANGPEEQATGWYYYLQDKMTVPFTAICINERDISPLQTGDEVEVLDLADTDDCMHEMFAKIQWENRGLAVPLSQLQPIDSVDENTQEAVADWHYWVGQGYELT